VQGEKDGVRCARGRVSDWWPRRYWLWRVVTSRASLLLLISQDGFPHRHEQHASVIHHEFPTGPRKGHGGIRLATSHDASSIFISQPWQREYGQLNAIGGNTQYLAYKQCRMNKRNKQKVEVK